MTPEEFVVKELGHPGAYLDQVAFVNVVDTVREYHDLASRESLAKDVGGHAWKRLDEIRRDVRRRVESAGPVGPSDQRVRNLIDLLALTDYFVEQNAALLGLLDDFRKDAGKLDQAATPADVARARCLELEARVKELERLLRGSLEREVLDKMQELGGVAS